MISNSNMPKDSTKTKKTKQSPSHIPYHMNLKAGRPIQIEKLTCALCKQTFDKRSLAENHVLDAHGHTIWREYSEVMDYAYNPFASCTCLDEFVSNEDLFKHVRDKRNFRHKVLKGAHYVMIDKYLVN